MITSHFWHSDIHMAFISVMHWHAIGTFAHSTIDMIRRFRRSLYDTKCNFLQRAQLHCKRCISYGNSVRLSVCHTPVLCQNDGT